MTSAHAILSNPTAQCRQGMARQTPSWSGLTIPSHPDLTTPSWPGLTHDCPVEIGRSFDLRRFDSMMALLGGHGHQKGRAMKHRNSVLHGMLSHLPWKEFDDLVAVHGADKWVRTLSTKCQFVALLIGQLSGFCSLRETVSGVNSQAARLYHLGAREIARSTFADANAQ